MPTPHRQKKHRDAKERKRLRDVEVFLADNPRIEWLKSHKRALSVLTVVLAVFVVIAFVFAQFPKKNGVPPNLYDPGQPGYDYTGGRTIQGPLIIKTPYNPCTRDFRLMYANLSCEQELSMFQNRNGSLPVFPIDMAELTDLVWKGFTGQNGITDLRQVAAAYWQQPEFYPGWRGNATVANMLAGGPYWTPRGYGTYPWVRGFNVTNPTAGYQVQTFDLLRTAFNVTHWQGFGLYAYFAPAAYALNGTVMFTQDPAIAASRIGIRMDTSNDPYYDNLKSIADFTTNVPNGGIFVLLPPTRSMFEPRWVVPLNLTLTIKDVTPGLYVIALGTLDPNAWLNQEYYLRYGESYVPSGSWESGPLMQYILQVGFA